MHGRDDRPVAATAIVMAVLFGVGALVQVMNSANELDIVAQQLVVIAAVVVGVGLF